MIVYYTTRPVNSREFLFRILREFYNLKSPEIKTGTHGKPYLNGSLYFNLSHSGNITALAVGEQEVGLDLELRDCRTHQAVTRRLTPAERQEDFLKVWTAKEAYVKYRGDTLAALLPRLTFENGALFLDGERIPEQIAFYERENCLFCVCTAFPQSVEFRLV